VYVHHWGCVLKNVFLAHMISKIYFSSPLRGRIVETLVAEAGERSLDGDAVVLDVVDSGGLGEQFSL